MLKVVLNPPSLTRTGLAGSLVVAIVIITYCIYLVQDFFDILKYEVRGGSRTNQKTPLSDPTANSSEVRGSRTNQKTPPSDPAAETANSSELTEKTTPVKY